MAEGHETTPFAWGELVLHPSLQLCESQVSDVTSLRRNLQKTDEDPISNWCKSEEWILDESNLTSWFPNDDKVAFFIPSNNKNKYEKITYRRLQEQLAQCPPFVGLNRALKPARSSVVAIQFPVEQMVETALVMLSVVAQNDATVVPLDPRMPVLRLLEAMQQQACDFLLSTESNLLEQRLLTKSNKNKKGNTYLMDTSALLLSASDESDRLFRYLRDDLNEIRMINYSSDAGLEWIVLRKLAEGNARIGANSTIEWQRTDLTGMTAQPPVQAPLSGVLDALDSSVFCNGEGIEVSVPTPRAMYLRTSGTTSAIPKVVPITRSHLLFASIAIAACLKLKRSDVNINSMPFYHIGGISCNLMAVLVSGGAVMMAGPLSDPSRFLDHIVLGGVNGEKENAKGTWYYASPSMHKAVALTARSRSSSLGMPLPNRLRFIRSASAHLSHELAVELSSIFQTRVIPTYGMSEAMPICSSRGGIDVRKYPSPPHCEAVDCVGFSAGTSLKIIEIETGETLSYDKHDSVNAMPLVGEICVKGPGVIPEYSNRSVLETHTPDGWLLTGDRGYLDRQGRLFIKGRSKELIKRGGEQVWPNQVDAVVEKVPGVMTAVTFGVPNELWGEEVAVAVLLDGNDSLDATKKAQAEEMIMTFCQKELNKLSRPSQIKIVKSVDELPRGPTGKYLRSKMATHLGVTAVDTGTMRVLELSTANTLNTAASTLNTSTSTAYTEVNDSFSQSSQTVGWLERYFESGYTHHTWRIFPSDALNGIRFITSCLVVQVHIGAFPNMTWLKFQGYLSNMVIFFSLGGFQTTASVAHSVQNDWARFVGTKIGSLHALFILSQVFALPGYLIFQCLGEDGVLDSCSALAWTRHLSVFVVTITTGLGHTGVAWFQSVFYMFLIGFPFVEVWIRRISVSKQMVLLAILAFLASGIVGILYLILPRDIFFRVIAGELKYSIIFWWPLLVASVIAAFIFRLFIEKYARMAEEDSTIPEAEKEDILRAIENRSVQAEHVKRYSKVWGIVTDVLSVFMFAMYLIVALQPNCLCVNEEVVQQIRPDEVVVKEEGQCDPMRDEVYLCDITAEEYNDFIFPTNSQYYRFTSNFSGFFGAFHGTAALALVWIFAMAFGNGITNRIVGSSFMTNLAPLGYPVYLFHMAVARYYWIATRGLDPQFWWARAGAWTVPVEWYEFFIILLITVVLGFIVNHYLASKLMPYTISLGVKVCSRISSCLRCLLCRGRYSNVRVTDDDDEENGGKSSQIHAQVKSMVRGLTGIDAKPSMKLQFLGLDSMGAAALLGMLRSSVPAAASLTLQELYSLDTVGDLVFYLEKNEDDKDTWEYENGE